MYINKMGSDHYNYDINNQDFGFEYKDIFCITDGCSEGLHSEVGAKLFVKKFQEFLRFKKMWGNTELIKISEIKHIFENVMDYIVDPREIAHFVADMRNYMCFTVVVCQKQQDKWHIWILGDGAILTQDHENIFTIHPIDHSNYPRYLAYSYIPQDLLNTSDGVFKGEANYFTFNDSDYKSVGIASDGVLLLNRPENSKYLSEFNALMIEMLKKKKNFKIDRFINRLNWQSPQGFFKDDVTIVMK